MAGSWLMTGSSLEDDAIQIQEDEEEKPGEEQPSDEGECDGVDEPELEDAQDEGDEEPQEAEAASPYPVHHHISSEADEPPPPCSPGKRLRRERPQPRAGSACPALLFWGLTVGAVGLAAYCAAIGQQQPWEEGRSPAAAMHLHSVKHLSSGDAMGKADMAQLQEKLQLKQMQVDLDTQVFTAKRGAARELIKRVCNLPDQICGSMMAAVGAREMKFHKKSSVPLDSNQGSYYGAWMWVREGPNAEEVEVAFKAASLTYQLKDVVTYKDHITDEPVVECEVTRHFFLFSSGTQESCKEVGRRQTVTPVPVFKQATMSTDEMQLVDAMMESMLANKVLESTGGVNAPAQEIED